MYKKKKKPINKQFSYNLYIRLCPFKKTLAAHLRGRTLVSEKIVIYVIGRMEETCTTSYNMSFTVHTHEKGCSRALYPPLL